MAVRVVNTCSIVRSTASSPSLASFRCRLQQFRAFQCRKQARLGFCCSVLCSNRNRLLAHGGFRSYSAQSLMDSVMEELAWLKKRKVRTTTTRMGLTSSGDLLEDKLEKRLLQKGILLEFKKDSERVLLAVAQKPDGKKNWMVSDQVLLETTNGAI